MTCAGTHHQLLLLFQDELEASLSEGSSSMSPLFTRYIVVVWRMRCWDKFSATEQSFKKHLIDGSCWKLWAETNYSHAELGSNRHPKPVEAGGRKPLGRGCLPFVLAEDRHRPETFTETHKNPFRVWEAARNVVSSSSQNQNVKNAHRFVGRPVRNVTKLRPRTSSEGRVQFCRDPLTWFWPGNRRSLNDEQSNQHKVQNKKMWSSSDWLKKLTTASSIQIFTTLMFICHIL